MEKIKYCLLCGKPISNGDIYHDMAVKYCDACRDTARREKDAARHRRWRRRTKDRYKQTEIYNRQLRETIEAQKQQNELLHQQIAIMREQIERMAKE